MVDWGPREDALHALVREATGLPEESVIWADQNAQQPENPFATLRVGELQRVGGTDVTTEEYVPTEGPGREVLLRTVGLREFTFSVQAFSTPTHGNASARALLGLVQSAAQAPGPRDALLAVGVVPFDVGPVQNLSALEGADFEGRALLSMRLYVQDTHEERTTYIETVDVREEVPPEGEAP